MSRIYKALSTFSFGRKNTYDWDKLIGEKTLTRNKWLVQVWTDLYFKDQEDEFIRKLSTDDMMKTKWFEKYGIREPNF